MTVTTQREECTATVSGRLLMSMELGRRQWKLGFTTGVGQRPRRRTLSTDAWDRLPEEIAATKRRFRLPVDAPVISCYEAGRDGFWIHRYLTSLGVENLVVDSSSIEVNRRARRAKTDRMDVEKLLGMLLRYVGGEQTGLADRARAERGQRTPTTAASGVVDVETRSRAPDEPDRGVARHGGCAAQGGREISGPARSIDAMERTAAARGAAGSPVQGMAESGAPVDADPRSRAGAPSDAPRKPRRSGRIGQTAPPTARHRRQCGLAIRDGALRLAQVPQSPPSRCKYRLGGHAVQEWHCGS